MKLPLFLLVFIFLPIFPFPSVLAEYCVISPNVTEYSANTDWGPDPWHINKSVDRNWSSFSWPTSLDTGNFYPQWNFSGFEVDRVVLNVKFGSYANGNDCYIHAYYPHNETYVQVYHSANCTGNPNGENVSLHFNKVDTNSDFLNDSTDRFKILIQAVHDGSNWGVIYETSLEICYSSTPWDCDAPYKEGHSRCGGYGMQMIFSCINDSGTFKWNDTPIFCDFGCLNGTCLSGITRCSDYCSPGESLCSSNTLFHCGNVTGNNCYDWDPDNFSTCTYGCINGRCIEDVDTCSYPSMGCNSDVILNCTQDPVSGRWKYSTINDCPYGCVIHSSSNVTCNELGSPHVFANAFNQFIYYVAYVFNPIIMIAYLVVVLIFSAFVVRIMDSTSPGLLVFILGTSIGVPFGTVPLPVGIIIVVFSFAFMRWSDD